MILYSSAIFFRNVFRQDQIDLAKMKRWWVADRLARGGRLHGMAAAVMPGWREASVSTVMGQCRQQSQAARGGLSLHHASGRALRVVSYLFPFFFFEK